MGKPLAINYKSTNHYLVDCRQGRLLLDPGWAGSLAELRAGLRRFGIDLAEIRYVMFTHGHPDHAGLAQEVKTAAGARLVIHRRQIPYLSELQAFHEKKGGYRPILVEQGDLVIEDDGQNALRAIGVNGRLIETPGHSDDSVTLLLDDGSAFVGDLHPPQGGDGCDEVCQSWRRLMRLHAQTVYPAHSGPFPIDEIARLLPEE